MLFLNIFIFRYIQNQGIENKISIPELPMPSKINKEERERNSDDEFAHILG